MSSKRKCDEPAVTCKKTKTEKDEESRGLFKGLNFYILSAGIEKARINVFRNQIIQNEGNIEGSFSDCKISHIVVDDKMDVERMQRLLGITDFPDNLIVVKTMWLSMCLKKKEMVTSDAYELKRPRNTYLNADEDDVKHNVSSSESKNSTRELSPGPSSNLTGHKHSRQPTSYDQSIPLKSEGGACDKDSDYEASDEELKVEEMDSQFGITRKNIPVNSWICAQSSKNPQPNLNKHITDKLEEMVKAYASTNDKWRSYGYQKCIRALMRHPKAISSWEEAKALPGVGGRLADKIWEIAQSGELRKLNEFKSSEEIRTLELFNNVWGAGPHTAQIWFQQGFRTIDDLRTKAKLTSQQKVGVRLYDDIIERMPREEAGHIADVVREAAESIQPGIIAQACGSYRRGKVTCGDVDVLVTHPDGRSHKGVFGKLLDKLHETGFLTDDLVSSEDNGNQTKYLGVCKLPDDNTKHRRLDIIVVPYQEYACALMYFTGSAHFNRSLRLLCKRQDMSLSEHALRGGVIRQGGERVHEGSIIPTPTEESIFKILKIPYRPPEERDH